MFASTLKRLLLKFCWQTVLNCCYAYAQCIVVSTFVIVAIFSNYNKIMGTKSYSF